MNRKTLSDRGPFDRKRCKASVDHTPRTFV